MSVFRAKFLNEIEDYFKNQGKFERGSEYFGMAGSQKTEILIEYVEQLTFDERSELTKLFVEIAIANEELIPNVPGAVPGALQALFHLCAKGYLKESNESVALLERMFTEPINIEIWVHAGEMLEEQGGSRFKETWHYAAAVSSILLLLESRHADETRMYLIDHAISEEFRDILKRQPESILFLRNNLQ